jgi:preprotein translocase subunit SecB
MNTEPQNPAQQGGEAQPRFNSIGQYIKDLSVENPNAPMSLQPRDQVPQIDINVAVNADRLNDTDYEVRLKLDARAGEGQDMMFNLELTYAGIFRIENVPDDQIQPFVFIEGPRFLFPFAREVIANATRQAGFPPLMVDPIDFLSLFRQRVAQAQQQGQAQQSGGQNPQQNMVN